jgi:hypothetical protein
MRPSSPRMSIPARNHLFGVVIFGEPSDLRHPLFRGKIVIRPRKPDVAVLAHCKPLRPSAIAH